ncbi:MAG: porin, partial [Oceanospirillales bacterium]
MKKSIIAMAVAGALAVPAIASADATLYGQFRVGLENVKGSTTNAFDGGNRIGVKGTVDLGLDSTVGIYQWEAGFAVTGSNSQSADVNTNTVVTSTTSLTQRNTFAGATGNWGTLIAGRFDHPTEGIQATTDIGNVKNYRSGTTYSDAGIHKTVAYVTPSLNGLTATIGGVFAGQPNNTPKETIDGYNMGVDYSVGGLGLKAAYGKLNTNNAFGAGEQNKWGLAATYQLDALKLAADYNSVNVKNGPKDTSYA